jgi:hypothetical protein
MTALNQGVDRRLAVALSGGTYGGPVVQMVDDQGATHNAKTFEVGNTALGADLINGVRTPVTVVFDAMPTVAGVVQAAEIKRLSLDLRISQQAQAPQRLEVQFRNVAIQKSQAAQTDGGDRSAGGKPAAQNGPTATARGPVTEARFSDVQFQFGEAVAEGKALTVTVWLTNQGIDRTISAGNVGNGVQLIDDSGNSYTPTEVTIGNRRNTSDIVNGIRTKVTLRFELPTLGGVIQAKQIARLTVDLQVGTPQHSDSGSIRFQDAPIQKK